MTAMRSPDEGAGLALGLPHMVEKRERESELKV
jgi:hypothetical protein